MAAELGGTAGTASAALGGAGGSATTAAGARSLSALRHICHQLCVVAGMVVSLTVTATALLMAVTPGVDDAAERVRALGVENRVQRLAGPLPAAVTASLIAVEDSRFRSHHGVDPRGALRALYGGLAGRTDQGGSTLNQQLAKALYTDGRRGPLDKAEQVALAVKLDLGYDKDDILRMYLDTVYFGHGYYGLRAASRGYFGREPAELDLPRAALLAGLVQAPDRYDPTEHGGLALRRRRHVLARLRATGVLDQPGYRAALAAPLGLRPVG